MDWELWAFIGVTILLLVAGGFIKRLVTDLKNFVDAVADAIADGKVDDQEIVKIIATGQVLGESIRDITKQILGLVRR